MVDRTYRKGRIVDQMRRTFSRDNQTACITGSDARLTLLRDLRTLVYSTTIKSFA